jgi:hypothetical protein
MPNCFLFINEHLLPRIFSLYYYKDLLVPCHNQSIFIRYLKEDKEPFIFPPPPQTKAFMDQAHVSELIYTMVNSLNEKAAHHPRSERPAFDITLENGAEPSVILSKISKHKRPKRRGKCPRLAPRDDGPFKRVNYIDRSKSLHQLKYSSVKPKHMPKKPLAPMEKAQIEKPKETIDNTEPIDHLSETKHLSDQQQADHSVQTPDSNVLNHGHEEATDLPAPLAQEDFSHDKDGNGESDIPLNDIEDKEIGVSLEKDIPENDKAPISEHYSLNQETEADQIDMLNEVPHHTGTDYSDQDIEEEESEINEEADDGSIQPYTTSEHVETADDYALAAEPDEFNEYEYDLIPEDMLSDEIEEPNAASEKMSQVDMMIEDEEFHEDIPTPEIEEAEYIEEVTSEEPAPVNEHEILIDDTPPTDTEEAEYIEEVTSEEPAPVNEHEILIDDTPPTDTEETDDQPFDELTYEKAEPAKEYETLTEDTPSTENEETDEHLIEEVTLEESEAVNEHVTLIDDIPLTENEEAVDQQIEDVTFEESNPANEHETITDDISSWETEKLDDHLIKEVTFEESGPANEYETPSDNITTTETEEADDHSIEEITFEESEATYEQETLTDDLPLTESEQADEHPIEEAIYEESEPATEHESQSEDIPSIGRMETDNESLDETTFEESDGTHTEESVNLNSDTTFVEPEETNPYVEVIQEEPDVSQEVDSDINTFETDEIREEPEDDHNPEPETHVVKSEHALLSDKSTPEEPDSSQEQVPVEPDVSQEVDSDINASETDEIHEEPVDDHHREPETHVVKSQQDLLSDSSKPEKSNSSQEQVPEENTDIEHEIDSLIEETPSELNEEPVEETTDQTAPVEIDSSQESDLDTTPDETPAEMEVAQEHHPVENETDDNTENEQDLLSDNITAEEFETAPEEALEEATIVDNDEFDGLNEDTPEVVQEENNEEITQEAAGTPPAPEAAASQSSTPSESTETPEEAPAKLNSGSSQSIPAEETETAGDTPSHTTQDQVVEESYTTILNKYFTLGDKINVYAGSKLLDKQGTFLTAGRDFFIWIDADGYVRLQLISGGISIGQKKKKK